MQVPTAILEALVDRRIVRIRRATNEEMHNAGWQTRPVVVELDDGALLVPMTDRACTDGGYLYVESLRSVIGRTML